MDVKPDVWAEMVEPLRRYMRRRVRDEHLADDLAQEALLKAQAALATAPPDDKLAAWVFRIARNTAIDFYRSPRGRGHVPLDQAEEPPSPAAEVEVTTDLATCLRPMVERLPQPYREAVELTEFEGLTQPALAQQLGISVSGAKSRVQRAREQLRVMLLGCCRIERDARGNVTDYEPTKRSTDYCGDADGKPSCGD
jgi:RNA polymerase sigma-70 factor, ECF subfamily